MDGVSIFLHCRWVSNTPEIPLKYPASVQHPAAEQQVGERGSFGSDFTSSPLSVWAATRAVGCGLKEERVKKNSETDENGALGTRFIAAECG